MIQRLKLTVTDKKRERFGDTWRFRVSAKPFSGNPVTFEILCHNHELTPEKIQEINNQFKTSLQYLKHHGGYYDNTADEKDVKAAMNKWSSTNTGMAIKVQDDPLPEFVPFKV